MYVPKFQKRIKKGDVEFFSNKKLLALKWKDKRDILMLTSIHNNEMRCLKNSRGENILKPAAIVDYNQNIGGVDKTDMLLSTTETVRKCIKWYKKVFFHLLDLAVLNSHVVYKMKTGENIALLDFQRQLVKSIIDKHRKVIPKSYSSNRPAQAHSSLRRIIR
ncbi:hypothetical protein JTB14_034448 [Gonioctena quinquepunctata]|nr:hypothetical protein JTB14_034448 [Gonioctena quinquepunctata]